MKKIQIVCLMVVFLFCSCQVNEKIIYDFEEDTDLDALNWRCKTLYSLSDIHVTSGVKSLKVEMYPDVYPGIYFNDFPDNWTGYKKICIDIFNPSDEKIKLVNRIDDTAGDPTFQERYNRKIFLASGMNNVEIIFDELVTSGGGRQLNINSIYKFMLFTIDNEKKIILYIDNIRFQN